MTAISKEQRARILQARDLIYPVVGTSLIFLASMTIAILFAETMHMQDVSMALPAVYWLVLPTTAALGILILWTVARESIQWKFYGFILGLLINIVVDIILNNPPLLQSFWFAAISLVLGTLTFFIPGLVLQGHRISLGERMQNLQERIPLTQLWASYSIQARYSQKALGVGWVMVYPFLEAVVIGFAFSVLMGRGEIAGKPFIVFLLSGIVMFNLFSRTVVQSTTSLLGTMGVIKQIYFPREIILLVLMGAELVNFFFAFLTLLLVNAVYGTYPAINYLILILPILIMAAIALGTSLYASFGNLVFRDLQQLILLTVRLLFYVSVLFSLRVASPKTAIIGLVNPLTALIEFFRSIVLYEQPPQLVMLLWPAALAAALLYSGYIFFAHNEDRFIDFF